VLRRTTHFYLFCDAETMFVARPEAERAGFRFWKPLGWDKRGIGMGYHRASEFLRLKPTRFVYRVLQPSNVRVARLSRS
jgi:hypothetical protein